MFYGILLAVYGYFSTRKGGETIIEDIPFRLHYTFTSGVLFLCTMLVGLQELVGKNIDCYSSHYSHKAISQYCWVTGTHLVVNTSNPRGFGPVYDEVNCEWNGSQFVSPSGQTCTSVHSYYQWVPYFLLLQAFLFYLPHLFWMNNEGDRISSLSTGIQATASISCNDAKIKNVAVNVANYIREDGAGHFFYGLSYIIAQVWNFLNIVFVFWLTDRFLEGQFVLLGHRWFRALVNRDSDSNQILYDVFPRLTKCEFMRVGTGGREITQDFLCVLAPNIISEKIFIFLWFWYLTLGVITAVNLVTIFGMTSNSPSVRKFYLARTVWTRKIRNNMRGDFYDQTFKKMNFGQFLFVYLLGRNVSLGVYKKILSAITDLNWNLFLDENGPEKNHEVSAPTLPKKMPLLDQSDDIEHEVDDKEFESYGASCTLKK